MKTTNDPMASIASAVAFAQDVVELARTHGLIPQQRGRKARGGSQIVRKVRAARKPANGHTDQFDELTQ